MTIINLATNPRFASTPVITHNPDKTGPWKEECLHNPTDGNYARLTTTKQLETAQWLWLTKSTLKSSTQHTISLRMRASTPIKIMLAIGDTTSPLQRVTTSWETYKFTGTTQADASLKLNGIGIPTADNPELPQGTTLDLASMCLVEGDYSGDYFDGSQLNGFWNGVPDKSSSTYIDPTGSRVTTIRNVKSYGAAGNGTTDDTAAIKNALDCAESFCSVYFPPGTYKVTQPLTWDPYRVALRGTAAEIAFNLGSTVASIVWQVDDVSTYAINVTSSAPFPDGAPFGNRGMQHSGIRFTTTDKACNGLWIAGKKGSESEVGGTFESGRRKNAHFTLSNMVFDGFNVAHRIGSYSYMMGFRDCVFSNSTWSSYLPDNETDRGERIYFEGCDFIKNADYGPTINMMGDQEYKFINCSFRDTQRLFYAGTASKLDFIGCHIETATKAQSGSTGFGKLAEQATVSFTNSVLRITAMSDVSATNPASDPPNIKALCEGKLTSVVNLQSTHLDLTGVEALGHDVRVNTAQTTVAEKTSPLPHQGVTRGDSPHVFDVIVDQLHNNLHDGVASYSDRLEELNTKSEGVFTYLPSDKSPYRRDHLVAKFTADGSPTVTLPVTIPSPGKILTSRMDLTYSDETKLARVTGVSIELLDRAGKIMETLTHPTISTTSPWELNLRKYTTITVRDRIKTNHNLIDKAQIKIALANAKAGAQLDVTFLGMTTYG